MKKFILALLALVCLFLASTATRVPIATAAPAADDVPQFGACRYYCNSGKSFTTASACHTACPNDFCEQVC